MIKKIDQKEKSESDKLSKSTPSYLLMMMEETTAMLSKLIVISGAMNPKALADVKIISKDQQSLLTRGIEDYLYENIIMALKKHMLDNHITYKQFKSKRE